MAGYSNLYYSVVNTTGNNTANTPSWTSGGSGSPNTTAPLNAGDLGILVVTGTGTATLPSAPSGWTLVTSGQVAGTSCTSSIFYRELTGGDSAPTVAGATGEAWSALLMEFSGNATSAPLDQHGTGTTATSGTSVATGAPDTQSGDLVISSLGLHFSTSATNTTGSSMNNGATYTSVGSTDGTSGQGHCQFGYGITTGNSAADTTAPTWTGSPTGAAVVIASFSPLSQTNAPAGNAPVTDSALNPTPSVAASSGVAPVTISGDSPTPSIGGAATLSTGTWAANNASVQTSGNTNAQAGNANVTVTGFGPSGAIGPSAGSASATWGAFAGTIPNLDALGAVVPVLNPFQMTQVTTPTASDSGTLKLYFKSDKGLYEIDPLGNEVLIGPQAFSGALPVPVVLTSDYTLPVDSQTLFRIPITLGSFRIIGGAGSNLVGV